jgi:hypothetical protein
MQVRPFPSHNLSDLFLFSQEIRYGLTNRILIRTTVPLAYFQQGYLTYPGIGDWETMLKARFAGDSEETLEAAMSL